MLPAGRSRGACGKYEHHACLSKSEAQRWFHPEGRLQSPTGTRVIDRYVAVDLSDELAPSGGHDGRKEPTLTLYLVRPGRPGPESLTSRELIDDGAVLVACELHGPDNPPPPVIFIAGENVEVRGHTAVLAVGKSAGESEVRTLTWNAVLSDGQSCHWVVGDATRHRSLEELVRIANALTPL